ncbi:MAG: DUF2065 family protein [bacterium]
MKWFLYTIGLLWVILGTVQVLYTEQSNSILKKIMVERNPKILGIFPFLIGVLLCVSALLNYSKEGVYKPLWFVFALGLLACIKGILFFLLPPHNSRKFLQWWFSQASDRFIRLWGLILVVLGVAILSWL